MNDYISRQAAIDEIRKCRFVVDAIEKIRGLPSAQPERGEWIPVTNGRGGFECSKCHDYAPSYKNGDEYLSHFCPNCGVDMRGEENG